MTAPINRAQRNGCGCLAINYSSFIIHHSFEVEDLDKFLFIETAVRFGAPLF